MSEERFVVENSNNEVSIKDKVKDNYPFALAYEHIDDADNLIQECLSLVGLLNDQQATIEEQNKEIEESSAFIIEQRIENKKLQEEIKLLKPTNIEQYEQIVQLQEENEKLRKELNDCEKFRYTVFKRLNDEHIKERSIK